MYMSMTTSNIYIPKDPKKLEEFNKNLSLKSAKLKRLFLMQLKKFELAIIFKTSFKGNVFMRNGRKVNY